MDTPRKGGGHSKGQTKPYAVIRSWSGGKPSRTAHWNLSSAKADMCDSLRASNVRDLELEIRVIDRATGETVREPQRCVVCGKRWATETGVTRGDAVPSLCGTCDEDDLPAAEPAVTATPSETAPLVRALRAKGLEPTVRLDGAVNVTANGIDWTLRPEPHAITGKPCGVWSAVGPAGPRGMFVATRVADFIARRTKP